jgi:methionine-rich copper-binding protein CopC
LPRSATVAAAFALLLAPWAASAHAILVSSTPAAGGSAGAGAVAMEFRFNSRIDHARSRLTLTAPDESQSVLPIAPGTAPDVLRTTATLPPGNYAVRWQVLAIDGHITRGDVPFVVTGH